MLQSFNDAKKSGMEVQALSNDQTFEIMFMCYLSAVLKY